MRVLQCRGGIDGVAWRAERRVHKEFDASGLVVFLYVSTPIRNEEECEVLGCVVAGDDQTANVFPRLR